MTEAPGLSGQLLVATPQIEDGVFHRGVVLLLHHDEDGAQGVVLNRPLAADVDSILPGWGQVSAPPPRVYQGGPVALDSAIGIAALAQVPREAVGVRRLFDGIGLVDLDSDPGRLPEPVLGVRIFAGYAGWTAGQLESEIASGSWYVVDREALDNTGPDAAHLWRAVLARQPGNLALVASYPADPALN